MRPWKSMLVVTVGSVLAFPLVTVGQGNTPPPCPPEWEPADSSIAWDSGSVRLEADASEMRRQVVRTAWLAPWRKPSKVRGQLHSPEALGGFRRSSTVAQW
jgi:hypothetical protein